MARKIRAKLIMELCGQRLSRRMIAKTRRMAMVICSQRRNGIQ